MQRFRAILAAFLAILWIAATQHCALEAAGILAHVCDHGEGATSAEHCKGDDCRTVEKGGYKISEGLAKVSPPQLVSCLCLLGLGVSPAPTLVDTEAANLPRPFFELPFDWVPSWQFVRRAAPPSRAPSLMMA